MLTGVRSDVRMMVNSLLWNIEEMRPWLITVNPFEGLKVIEKKKNISEGSKAYTPAQLKDLFKLADSYGKNDRRY